MRSMPAKVTTIPVAPEAEEAEPAGLEPGVSAGLADARMVVEGAVMVRMVVAAVTPLGVTDDGAKRQVAPTGSPPVQAKVMVERKPPVGVTVRVTGFETLPGATVVEELEDATVKAPAGSRIVSVAEAELLGR
jgi:hypothetical protein